MSTTTVETAEARYVELFSRFGRAARGVAIERHTKGDTYGEVLAEARSRVYDQCAELVRKMSASKAAAEMMSRAKAQHVRTAPLIGFDSAGTQYVAARAYQFCAWQIDSSLPEMAPKWD